MESPTSNSTSYPAPSEHTTQLSAISRPSQSSNTPLRTKPSNVQTNILPFTNSIPSAVSASPVTTASSVAASPIMSPEPTQITTNNSSIQGSPDGPRGREIDYPPPDFELPQSIVSRKSSQSAMSEAMSMNKSPGLIRRLSNRASNFTNRRRQSSTTAMSRDHSSGPVTMRRRSDSTNTAPDGIRGSMFSDSDTEQDYYQEPGPIALGIEGLRDFPSTTASISSTTASAAPISGPVIPSILLQGTTMTKVTKKKNKKMLTFVLEHEAAKVSWGKNKSSKSFYIDDITDIRAGSNASNYRQEFGVSPEDEQRFFSIVYVDPDKSKGRSQKVMHLIAADDQAFSLWTSTLDAISKHRQDLMTSLSAFHDKAVKTYWQVEMAKLWQGKPHTGDDEEIDIIGVERLCRQLHIHCSSMYIHSRFSKADVSRSGRLNFVEFQEFVKLMKKREDIRPIYRELAVSDYEKGITQEEFFNFVNNVQNEDVEANRSHWESVFAKFARQSKSKDQTPQIPADVEIPRMNEAALTNFMISTFNVPLRSAPKVPLDRPVNEYFISSSHNTYLLGRQVAGESSVEAYISALNKGCRCVEVDCWDGKDGQPIVMHGRTLTSHVSFKDVMSTISKYAFVKSEYPLWISLEVHCNPAQQAIMAQIIKDTCGSKLVTQPIDPTEERLPSPEQLIGQILVKVKTPRILDEPVSSDSVNGRSRGSSVSSPYIRPTQQDNPAISAGLLPPSPYTRPPNNRLVSQNQFKQSGSELDSLSSSTSDSESLTEVDPKTTNTKSKAKTSKIVKVLGELGVYSAGVKFRGYDAPESKTYNHIYSFMENTFDKNSRTQEDRRALTRHNMRFLMRVYPNGWRVASTNFDPLRYWRRGVQMVALNWQTSDLGMQLNEAMYAMDQSGYVLKPRELREITMIPTVPEEAGIGHVKRERKNVSFSIDVISAQQLMRPKGLASNRTVDPYIEVEVYHADDKEKDNKGVIGEGGLEVVGKDGSSGLGTPHRRRTHIVAENGFNPIFDKKFNFALTTKYPDLVFVRWTVRCSSDGSNYSDRGLPLATYTAKLSSLQQGYRTLPLYDSNGDQFLFSTLFCRIKIEPVTSIYVNAEEQQQNVNMIKRVFNRTPMSPKLGSDSSHQ